MGRSLDLMSAINGPHPPLSPLSSLEPPIITVEPKMWSYVRINHDLLKEDTDSIENIIPSHCWWTMEAAREAAEQHHRADEESDVAEGYPPTVLKWEEHFDGLSAEPDPDVTFIVFSMYVKG